MVGQEINDQRLAIMLKCAVFACGVGLAGISIYTFAIFDIEDPADFFLAVYYILFGILCCLMELPWQKTLLFFAFLGSYIGKSLYLLFCFTLVFTWEPWWQMIIAIVLIISSGMYLLLALTCKAKLIDNREQEQSKQEERKEKSNESPAQQEIYYPPPVEPGFGPMEIEPLDSDEEEEYEDGLKPRDD